MRDVGQVDPVDHHHRQLQIGQVPAQQIRQRRARPGHERARHRRLRRRPGVLLNLLADRLSDPPRPAGRDAGEHPLQHHLLKQIPRAELAVTLKADLLAVIGSAHPRPADRHPPPTKRDLPARAAVTLGPILVVAALGADDLRSTSHSIVSCSTARPVPTASASSPSFACPAIPASDS